MADDRAPARRGVRLRALLDDGARQWDAGQLDTAWYGVVQVIAPNWAYDATRGSIPRRRCRSSPARSRRVEGRQRVLRLRGYEEFPVLVGRWECTAEDVYATTCPGMEALGDINQLQFSEKRALEGIDKQVRPPLVAPSALRNAAITQIPGGVTFDDLEAKSGVRPLFEAKPDLAGLEAKQDQVRNRIRQSFFADLFLMLSYMDDARASGQPVTATEIGERKEEKLLALGPMLNRLNKDVFGPFIDRVFQIMKPQGRLRPAPEALQGRELSVEYISVLHAAQKAGGLAQIERFIGFTVNLAKETQDPSVLDPIDMDETIRTYHDMSGVPPKLMRDPRRSSSSATAARKQQQQAAQAEQLKTIGAGARDLSQADTSGR
jgi:hypothetical protein